MIPTPKGHTMTEQTTPALPKGWRLADHEKYGRIIVTNTVPNSSGYVYYVIPEDGDHRGYGWGPCKPDELTYLAQGADQ